jgi:cytochrome c-type biogenesis protein CcmH
MTNDLSTLRHQLQTLKALHEAGDLSAQTYEQSRAEIERKIVEQVMAAPASVSTGASVAATASRPSWALLGGVALAAVGLATAGYWWAGSPSAVSSPASGGPSSAEAASPPNPHATGPGQMAEMTEKLAVRLKEKPDDPEGWVMLARSYAVLGRHTDAVPAYRRALALQPAPDAQLLADFADALAVTSDRRLDGEAGQMIDRALKLDPDNLKALSLAGTAAFDRKDYATAVKHWERVQRVAPADSIYRSQVQGSIAEARELGKMPPAATTASTAALKPASATPPTATSAAATPARVSGSVKLSPALAGKAAPSDTVFVFARPADGSRMPLAILRTQVKDLPLQFTLDDSLSMSPAAKLSGHKTVIVGARISKSGDAMPQPGDFTGLTEPVAVGSSGIQVEIDQTVPK